MTLKTYFQLKSYKILIISILKDKNTKKNKKILKKVLTLVLKCGILTMQSQNLGLQTAQFILIYT